MQTDLSRIALRPFRLSDADDVLSFGGDDQVTRVLRGFKTLTTKDDVDANFLLFDLGRFCTYKTTSTLG
ncbi:hypothetical protein ACFX1S_010617 [Malus domestica]